MNANPRSCPTGSLPFLAVSLLALVSNADAHDPTATQTFVSPLPTMPLDSSILFVTLVGPEVGLSVVHATLDVAWESDGTFPASDLLLHYELSIDNSIADLVVTGADLGWGSGEGTFTATLETEILNGQTVQGALFGTKFELDIATSTGTGGVTGRFLPGSELRLETSNSFRNLDNTYSISLLAGGTQQLGVRAPASEAGRLYWIFGTTTGTSPGLSGPAGTLPLNYDPYFQFTIDTPNFHIKKSRGFLNAEGNANAVLTINGGLDPSLAGVDLHHAFVVFDLPGTAAATFVSNPLVLHLVP